jgi:monoamine oxidase
MDADLIIIGAGASGLAAARKLSGSGLRILVLEARDRIGGRIHTSRPGGSVLPIELGAEFVHGTPAETWDIIHSANLSACDVNDTHWFLQDGTLSQDTHFWEETESIFEGMNKIAEPDLSFAEYLQKYCESAPPRAREMAWAFVEGFDAADAKLVGVRGLAEEQEASSEIDEERSFRLIDGYDRIIEWLAGGCDPTSNEFRLGVNVSSIEWERGAVTIRGSAQGVEQVWKAPKALVTVPLGLLKAEPSQIGAIRFDPPLADKQQAMAKLEIGAVVKTILEFGEAFWERESFATLAKDESLKDAGFLHARGPLVFTWWTMLPVRAPVLVGWSGGPSATKLSHRPHHEIISEAIKSLSKFLGLPPDDLRTRLQRATVADWQADPFSRGAYSYAGVGGTGARGVLAQPVAGTIFFAGEATHEGQSGTVAGAIASGYHAAEQILSA